MRKVPTRTQQTDRIGFPWDLTEWINRETLRQWIQEDVASLDWENPLLSQYLQAHPRYRPKMVLTLMLYAYATGVYASEDIAEQCYGHPAFRAICGPEAAAREEIERFRRENRDLLKRGLQQILTKCLRERYALGDGPLPPGLRPHVENAALTRLDIARHLDRSAQAA